MWCVQVVSVVCTGSECGVQVVSVVCRSSEYGV